MAKILFVGDQHVQVSNLSEIDLLIQKIVSIITENEIEIVILGGDMLHTHERLHTTALNKACEFIDTMRTHARTFVLVGNHDYEGNQQFLTNRHWLNPLKEWDNVVIVDKVICEYFGDSKCIFVPYVPPGRFVEALNTCSNSWLDAACIFAHQEFKGCKMGAIESIEGDEWLAEYPLVVSGHIHSRQIIGTNIYYSGSAMQHAFGESEHNSVVVLKFGSDSSFPKSISDKITEIPVDLPRKRIVYIDADSINDYTIPSESEDKIKLTVYGDTSQFQAIKKTQKYKKIVENGIKVVFKPDPKTNNDIPIIPLATSNDKQVDLISVLHNLILSENDPYLQKVFSRVILKHAQPN